MNLNDLSTLGQLVITGLSIIVSIALVYFGFVNKLTDRLSKVEARTELFWVVLEPHLAGIIHSPTHATRDELVEKLVKKTITNDEILDLNQLLTEITQKGKPDDKYLAAALLLARVKILILERAIVKVE